MPKIDPIQTNVTAGEISPHLYGRVDISKYRNAVKILENYIATVEGGFYRRSGFRFVREVKYSSKETVLIPFEFSTVQAYQIETGDQYMRFYKDEGIILSSAKVITAATNASPIVITSNAHGFTNGHEVKISGVLGNTAANGTWTVAGVTANTFQLSGSTGNAAYTSGGTAVETIEISTPYLEADLMDVRYVQSADVLYLAHNIYQQRKLTRSSHTTWTMSTIDFTDGPYMKEKTDLTITPSATTGSVTLTASAPLWSANDVGRLVRLKHSAAWSWFKITVFTDTTHVTADAKSTTTASASSSYRLGSFFIGNYPATVVFFGGRLWWANTTAEPQGLWGSMSADYENMTPSSLTDGSVADNNAIEYILDSNKVNAIRSLDAGPVLSILTSGTELQAKAGSIDKPITQDNIQITPQTASGSSKVASVRVGSAVLFVQRSGRKLREYKYNFQEDSFVSKNISVMARHLFRKTSYITDMVYQQEPDSIVWLVRSDGIIVGVTYDNDQDVKAFYRLKLGGNFAGGTPITRSISVIPTSDGTSDQMWAINKRTINASTKRYIEFLEEPFDPDDENDKDDMFFVDSGLTYSGSPTSSITGLTHLIGETVQVVADGSAHPDRTVGVDGSIALDNSYSTVHVGLQCISRVKTLTPEANLGTGTIQGKVQRAHRVTVRFLNSISVKCGKDFDNLEFIPFRELDDPMDSSPPLFTGDKDIEIDMDLTKDGSFCLQQDLPYPSTILDLIPHFVVYQEQ